MIDVESGPAVVLIFGIEGRWKSMGSAVDALPPRCRVTSFSLAVDTDSDREFDLVRGFANYLDQPEAARGSEPT
jgi:hypothetical protein